MHRALHSEGLEVCIGNTPLISLRHIAPTTGARVLVKIESQNPTGRMKDRMALAMIEAAEKDGRLKPGDPVVEYTGGSTGVSLSLVCAVKRYPLFIVSSDAFSREKIDFMRILGAQVQLIASDAGRMTEKLTRDMIEAARLIASDTGGYWTNQLHNSDQLPAYRKMGDEIGEQTGGRIDGFVQSVGTGACFRGNAESRGRNFRRHIHRRQCGRGFAACR